METNSKEREGVRDVEGTKSDLNITLRLSVYNGDDLVSLRRDLQYS